MSHLHDYSKHPGVARKIIEARREGDYDTIERLRNKVHADNPQYKGSYNR